MSSIKIIFTFRPFHKPWFHLENIQWRLSICRPWEHGSVAPRFRKLNTRWRLHSYGKYSLRWLLAGRLGEPQRHDL